MNRRKFISRVGALLVIPAIAPAGAFDLFGNPTTLYNHTINIVYEYTPDGIDSGMSIYSTDDILLFHIPDSARPGDMVIDISTRESYTVELQELEIPGGIVYRNVLKLI